MAGCFTGCGLFILAGMFAPMLLAAVPLLFVAPAELLRILLPVAGGVGVGVWVAQATSAREARTAGDPDPLLVLLPDGFVEYASLGQPVLGFQFEEFVRVEQGFRASSSSDSTSTSVTMWLDLYRRDGSCVSWRPRSDFGPAMGVCQEIVKAHAGYMARS